MGKSTDSPRIIELPRIYDPRGNLTFVENGDNCLPFRIERVHWTYDIPAGAERGGHAHYTCSEVVVAAAGSFCVKIFDGRCWSEYMLNRPYQGLLLPPGYWRVLDNYASGSICLTMADEPYREDDYIRDIDEFIRLKTQ